jgi:hypothetical protein
MCGWRLGSCARMACRTPASATELTALPADRRYRHPRSRIARTILHGPRPSGAILRRRPIRPSRRFVELSSRCVARGFSPDLVQIVANSKAFVPRVGGATLRVARMSYVSPADLLQTAAAAHRTLTGMINPFMPSAG